MARFSTYRLAWALGGILAIFFLSENALGAPAAGDKSAVQSALQIFSDRPVDSLANEPLYLPKLVASFYRDRGNRPVWTENGGKLSNSASQVIEIIRDTIHSGMRPEAYHLKAIDRLNTASDMENAERAASLEILLTDAYFKLGEHFFAGVVDASSVNPDWTIRRRRINMKKQLERAITDSTIPDVLRLLEPQDDRYQKLKASLTQYQGFRKFPKVSPGAILKPGMRSSRVAQLRSRLSREGYLGRNSADPNFYDEDLRQAVLSFQSGHGLAPNGIVGKKMITELNVSLAARTHQLMVNLERLRWLPRELGNSYLFVDIAGFTLTSFEEGQPALTMKIIVGDDRKVTPLFTAKLRTIILNPSWVVPKSIVTEEIVPQLKADPSYLKKKGIRVFATIGGKNSELDPEAIDWSQYKGDEFSYSFEAPSGPHNPLGSIKFLLPNEFSVYLHGTPDTKLFERERRTLSHGCIRVERPVALAAHLLKDSTQPWSETELEKWIGTGTSLSLNLPTPVPVYLWYRTAWAENDGRVNFRSDIYNWDPSLWAALVR